MQHDKLHVGWGFVDDADDTAEYFEVGYAQHATAVDFTGIAPMKMTVEGLADQLTGAPSDLVYADASCSGGDPLALCAGAIFAFPATWGSRLRGAAVGFTLILPAFQVGLFAALWVAVAGGVRSWRRALIGLGGMVLVQAALGVPVDELAHHYGFDPHVGLLRGWALALPAAAVWCLTRPAPFTVLDAPAPSGALRVTG